MSVSETLATTSYLRLPFDTLLATKLSGVAMKMCLFLCRFTSIANLKAFVPMQTCANEFGCSVRQVERMLKVLAKLGLIELTGHNELGKPTVKVLWWGQEPEAAKEEKKFDEPRPKGRTKKEDHNYKNKQQPIELSALGNELHALSIAKSVAAALLKKFGDEACASQLEHLQYLLDQGQKIRNKAAWLIRAIQNDYALPEGFKSKEQVQQQAEIKRQEQELKKLESKVQHLFDDEHYEKAVVVLTEFPNSKLMHQAQSKLSRQQKLSQAANKLNQHQKEHLMAQAWANVQKCLKSSAKPLECLKSTKLYQDAAQGFFENAVLQM